MQSNYTDLIPKVILADFCLKLKTKSLVMYYFIKYYFLGTKCKLNCQKNKASFKGYPIQMIKK